MSSPPATNVKVPLYLRAVRQLRTFNPRSFLHEHTTIVYCIVAAGVIGALNYKQWKRMKSIYPDYDKYAKLQGARYNEAKQQELHDVMRYNDMVTQMRDDMKQQRQA